jgi:hypothetical protein
MSVTCIVVNSNCYSTTSSIIIILGKLDYTVGDSGNIARCGGDRVLPSPAKVPLRCCSARPAAVARARPEVYDTLMFRGYLGFCLLCIADRTFVDWSSTYRFVNKERTDPSWDLYAQRIMYGVSRHDASIFACADEFRDVYIVSKRIISLGEQRRPRDNEYITRPKLKRTS